MNYLWSSNNMIMTDRNCSKFKKFIAKILMDNPISIFVFNKLFKSSNFLFQLPKINVVNVQ